MTKEVFIKDVMVKPTSIAKSAKITEALDKMLAEGIDPLIAVHNNSVIGTVSRQAIAEKNISSVPVVEGGSVLGIITKTDLMKSVFIRGLILPVRDVMEDVVTVNRYHSLDHVISVMRERNDKVLVMDDDGEPAGIITETNLAFYEDEPKISGVVGKDVAIMRRENANGTRGQSSLMVASVTAEDVMTSPVVTVPAATSLPEAIALMDRHHVNSLVVMEKNTISGILKRDDIIKEVAK